MTNPSLVEAIENEFFPVLVYNNRKGGPDEELLRRFQEPAWDYQVIRFLDAAGRDVIPRKDRVWTTGGVASRMVEALEAANRPVPKYLEDLQLEENTFSGLQIVDIGSGPHPSAAAFKNCKIFCLDPLLPEYLKTGFPFHIYEERVRFAYGYSENMPFTDQFFDAIISVNANPRATCMGIVKAFSAINMSILKFSMNS